MLKIRDCPGDSGTVGAYEIVISPLFYSTNFFVAFLPLGLQKMATEVTIGSKSDLPSEDKITPKANLAFPFPPRYCSLSGLNNNLRYSNLLETITLATLL